jgi:hypothetical protein
MTQKVQIILIDDIDGSEAAETVRFGLDGTHYEIDLNQAHATALRNTLARYTGAARKVSGTARRAARNGSKAPGTVPDNAEVRDWARANGLKVNDRGRIPGTIVASYREATDKAAGA